MPKRLLTWPNTPGAVSSRPVALIVWLAPIDHVTMLPKNVNSRATTTMSNSHDAPPRMSLNMSLSASTMPVTMLTSAVLVAARIPNVANT